MQQRKLLVIVCVTAGKQKRVVSEIRDFLDERTIPHDVVKIASPLEVKPALKKVKVSEFAAVAVYGGDGTIIAALKAFGQKQLPVLILQGGTANVLAKYHNLPPDTAACLAMYASNTYVIERVDIATLDNEPLVLDMHMGLWTQAIKATPRKYKKHVGEAAYVWSAVKQKRQVKPQQYSFSINKSPAVTMQAYTFIIANQGNHNILGVPLFPREHAPGLVQVAIIKDIRLSQFARWFIRRLAGKKTNEVIEVHRARHVQVTQAPKSALVDDVSRKLTLPFTVNAGELSAKILVPPTASKLAVVKKILRRLHLFLHRMQHRLKTLVYGRPVLRSSHVAPNLYLGGKYTAKSYDTFKEWGVTGIVSMRTHASPSAPEGVEILSLPTDDWHPPTLDDLRKGSEFIKRHIKNNGAVYVHCRLGEGRGPTMAAAYLITQGFTVDEAISQLVKYRPVVHPNARQRKRLAEWQEHFNNQ